MPYICQFSDGTYFRKVGRKTRSRVADLQQATSWVHKSHIKLALREVFGSYLCRDWPTDFQIIKVKLAKYGKRDSFSVKRGESYRSVSFEERAPEPEPVIKSELASDEAESRKCPDCGGDCSPRCWSISGV